MWRGRGRGTTSSLCPLPWGPGPSHQWPGLCHHVTLTSFNLKKSVCVCVHARVRAYRGLYVTASAISVSFHCRAVESWVPAQVFSLNTANGFTLLNHLWLRYLIFLFVSLFPLWGAGKWTLHMLGEHSPSGPQPQNNWESSNLLTIHHQEVSLHPWYPTPSLKWGL